MIRRVLTPVGVIATAIVAVVWFGPSATASSNVGAPALEGRGVTFAGEHDTGVCKMAFFTDTEGNALMLHRRYAP